MDCIELNEAFASVACACSSELSLDPDKTNPNGGAIPPGFPVVIILFRAHAVVLRPGGGPAY
jgi:acetyl-CoA acetyltransferase